MKYLHIKGFRSLIVIFSISYRPYKSSSLNLAHMLSHLALSWHLPPALFMLWRMPYLLIALRYNSLVYCVPLIQHQDILPKLMLYHKSKGRQHFRLSLLDCLTAKPGGAVNGGSARAVHLAVDWLDWVCYSLSVVCKSFVKISSPAHNHFLPK